MGSLGPLVGEIRRNSYLLLNVGLPSVSPYMIKTFDQMTSSDNYTCFTAVYHRMESVSPMLMPNPKVSRRGDLGAERF